MNGGRIYLDRVGKRFISFWIGRLSGSLAFTSWLSPHTRPTFWRWDRVGKDWYFGVGPLTLTWRG